MNNQAMPSPQFVAVIEDDLPTSNQLKGWIEAARPGLVVHQWFTRDDAEAAAASAPCLLSALVALPSNLFQKLTAYLPLDAP